MPLAAVLQVPTKTKEQVDFTAQKFEHMRALSTSAARVQCDWQGEGACLITPSTAVTSNSTATNRHTSTVDESSWWE